MTDAAQPSPDDEYDSPWKDALDRYFEPFLALLFPAAHAGIDWSRGYEMLDKELQQIVRDADLGRHLADKLVKVWKRDGEEIWVLVHVEVQGEPDPEFPRRMYTYNYRIYDRYGREVASFGVLGDDRPNWRPTEFRRELWGCRTGIEFPVAKLLDYEERWEDLEQSTNPFALVVMAHLRTRTTRRNAESRLQWKLRIVRDLYRRGYNREDVLELFRFIDWMMALPPDLEQQFEATVEAEAKGQKMPYLTVWERRGMERGLEQGLEQGVHLGELREARRSILGVLQARFTDPPTTISEELEAIEDEDRLRWLLQRAVTVESVARFQEELTAGDAPAR